MTKRELLSQLRQRRINVEANTDIRNRGSIFDLTGPRGECSLYIKESHALKPFWGLTENILKALQSFNSKWFVVFLDTSSKTLYVVPGKQILLIVSSKNLASDGDYKINISDVEKFKFNSNISDLIEYLGIGEH